MPQEEGDVLSGSTQRTWTGRYFELTLSTPCIAFAVDPETGESEERQFHAEAAERFERRLREIHPGVAEAVLELARVFALDLVPFDPTTAVSVVIPDEGLASLRISFRPAPSPDEVERLQAWLRKRLQP